MSNVTISIPRAVSGIVRRAIEDKAREFHAPSANIDPPPDEKTLKAWSDNARMLWEVAAQLAKVKS